MANIWPDRLNSVQDCRSDCSMCSMFRQGCLVLTIVATAWSSRAVDQREITRVSCSRQLAISEAMSMMSTMEAD